MFFFFFFSPPFSSSSQEAGGTASNEEEIIAIWDAMVGKESARSTRLEVEVEKKVHAGRGKGNLFRLRCFPCVNRKEKRGRQFRRKETIVGFVDTRCPLAFFLFFFFFKKGKG